jgi:hypothetical protein
MTETQDERTDEAPEWELRADSGRFACLLVHPSDTTCCEKEFASKQGLEMHRRRTGVQEPGLPSRRTVSRFFGLNEQGAKLLKASRNDSYVANYRRSAKGRLATFRARHSKELRLQAAEILPYPEPLPPPAYLPPPILWLLAKRPIPAEGLADLFASTAGGLRIDHRTWSLQYHPDHVQVSKQHGSKIMNRNPFNPFCEYLHLYSFFALFRFRKRANTCVCTLPLEAF